MKIQIGVIGDYNESITAHIAINKIAEIIKTTFKVEFDFVWVGTDKINSANDLLEFSGIWCVPGSPYRSTEGVLTAISYARESNVPYLGTCAGFQYAMIEYARNIIGINDADHTETNPDTKYPVIFNLSCPLVEKVN